MPLTPGTVQVATNPLIYWAPLGSDLIHINTRYADCLNTRDFPAAQVPAMKEIRDTINGAVITSRAPTVRSQGERFGTLRSIPSGDDGITVGLQSALPEWGFIELINSFAKQSLSAQAYVLTLTVSAGATANGNVTVTLPGLAPVVVPVLSTDTTPSQVATKIAAASFMGWTPVANAGVVTFTKTTPGYVAGSNQSGTITFATNTGAGSFGANPTTWGRDAADSNYVDASVDPRFLLTIVGKFDEGSTHDVNKQFVFYSYAARVTNNAETPHRWKGLDALIRPNVTLECEPYPLSTTQLAKSGTVLSEHDRALKATYFISNKAA